MLPLHGLSLLLSKVEWGPTAHEERKTEWNLMVLTYPLVMYHINWYIFTQFTQLNKGQLPLCSCSRCVHRSHKCIRQAAHNAGQPYPLLSHQIHRISRGTPPWTTGLLELPSARLCIHHRLSQRDGPPFLVQGTQQQQDGHPWHTGERHCVLPALNNRNILTRDHHLCTHAFRRRKEIDNSRCEVVHVTNRHIHLLCYRYTLRWVTWNIAYYQKPYKVTYTMDSSMNRPAQWSITLWHCTNQCCGETCERTEKSHFVDSTLYCTHRSTMDRHCMESKRKLCHQHFLFDRDLECSHDYSYKQIYSTNQPTSLSILPLGKKWQWTSLIVAGGSVVVNDTCGSCDIHVAFINYSSR